MDIEMAEMGRLLTMVGEYMRVCVCELEPIHLEFLAHKETGNLVDNTHIHTRMNLIVR